MSLLLGTQIPQPIQISNSYLIDILKQVKHYLTLQTGITLSENEHCLTIASARKLFSTESNNRNMFNIPKNFAYLFTHFQKIFVQNEQDLEFFDVCYECLMIVKEYLPNKVQIVVEIMGEVDGEGSVGNLDLSLVDFVENFESEKNEQFSRRVNSNFKTLISQPQTCITKFEVQNILYLAEHFYFYKNKLAALKYLAYNEQIPKQVFAQVGDECLGFLKELALDEDFRAYCEQVMEKVAVAREIVMSQDCEQLQEMESAQKENCKNKKNNHQSDFIDERNSQSPLHYQKQFRLASSKKAATKSRLKDRSPLKLSSKQNKNLNRVNQKQQKDQKLLNLSVKSLLFQLRQSQSLKRLAMLIEAAADIKIQDEKYEIKIEKEIENICRKFLKESYLERYETEVVQDSRKKVNFQRQQKNYIDESFIPTTEQVQQVSRFYKSLVAYFSRRNPSLKVTKKQDKKFKSNPGNENKSSIGQNTRYHQLLEQICKKIEQKYYSQ